MGIVEKMGKSKENEVLTPEDPAVKQGPSLVEVLRGNNSRYLGEMLKNSEDSEALELATRMAGGELDEGDISLLEKYRVDFNKRMEAIQQMENSITADNVALFAKGSPEFQKIINLLGPDKAANAIKVEIKNLAFGDQDAQDRFTKIREAVGKMEAFKSDKTSFEELEGRMEETYEKYKLSDGEFEGAIQEEDPALRTQKMRELVKGKYGGLQKLGLFFFIGKGKLDRKAAELSGFKDDIDATIEERMTGLQEKIDSVGKVLAISMDQNQGMRHALSREIIGEQHPDREKNSGFKEIQKELPNIKAANEGIDKAWIAFKTESGFDSLTDDAEKEAKKKEFLAGYKEQNKDKFKGEGFWSFIFASMFNALVDKKESELE